MKITISSKGIPSNNFYRFYQIEESIEKIPRIYEFYKDFTPIRPSYSTLSKRDILIKNTIRKQRVNDQYLKDNKVKEIHSTFLNSELLKTSLMSSFNTLILDKSFENKTCIYFNSHDMSPYKKNKKFSLSVSNIENVNCISNQSNSFIKQDIESLSNKANVNKQINPFKNKNPENQLLQVDCQNYSHVLNISQQEMICNNDTTDKIIICDFINKIVVNKKVIIKKKQIDNLNKQVINYNTHNFKMMSPVKKTKSVSKAKDNNIKGTLNLNNENKQNKEIMELIENKTQQIGKSFSKIKTKKINLIKEKQISTIKSEMFRKLAKSTNYQNPKQNNLVTVNPNINTSTTKKVECFISDNMKQVNTSKEKSRPIFNISVNSNLEVINNPVPTYKLRSPMSYLPLTPKVNNSKVRLPSYLVNSNYQTATKIKTEENVLCSTASSYRSLNINPTIMPINLRKESRGNSKRSTNKRIPSSIISCINQSTEDKGNINESKSIEKKISLNVKIKHSEPLITKTRIKTESTTIHSHRQNYFRNKNDLNTISDLKTSNTSKTLRNDSKATTDRSLIKLNAFNNVLSHRSSYTGSQREEFKVFVKNKSFLNNQIKTPNLEIKYSNPVSKINPNMFIK